MGQDILQEVFKIHFTCILTCEVKSMRFKKDINFVIDVHMYTTESHRDSKTMPRCNFLWCSVVQFARPRLLSQTSTESAMNASDISVLRQDKLKNEFAVFHHHPCGLLDFLRIFKISIGNSKVVC